MLTHSLQINVNGRVVMEATGEGWLISDFVEGLVDHPVTPLQYILGLKVNESRFFSWLGESDEITARVTRISQSASELTNATD